MKRAIIPLSLLLLAQTNVTTIDFSAVVNIIYALLPLFITIMVIMIIFKFLDSIMSGLSSLVRATRFSLPLLLLAQTQTDTIDFSSITNILYAILPLLITIMLFVVIFKFLGNIIEGLGSIVRFVKARLLLPLLLVAQTNGTELAQQLTAKMTPVLMVLITIIILIALPILVFKVLAKAVIDTIRG